MPTQALRQMLNLGDSGAAAGEPWRAPPPPHQGPRTGDRSGEAIMDMLQVRRNPNTVGPLLFPCTVRAAHGT